MPTSHSETHKSSSIGWLRAAVLGANDGLISTSSLVVGVAAAQPEHELEELAGIYVVRGLSPALAQQVAMELTAHDALGAHARDELGIHDLTRARPVQAALSSAAAFAVGAGLPVLFVFVAPTATLTVIGTLVGSPV